MWSRLVAGEDRHGSTAKGSSPCALELQLHTHMIALPGLWTKLIWGLRGRDEFKVRPSVCLVVTRGWVGSRGSITASSVLGGGGDSSGWNSREHMRLSWTLGDCPHFLRRDQDQPWDHPGLKGVREQATQEPRASRDNTRSGHVRSSRGDGSSRSREV